MINVWRALLMGIGWDGARHRGKGNGCLQQIPYCQFSPYGAFTQLIIIGQKFSAHRTQVVKTTELPI
jgi:hypothetical protein